MADQNALLLYRNRTGVTVSQVLNGYYSRVDNSVGIGFAHLGAEQIIEISTANSMPPSLVSYFFVIDPKTKQAVPKNIFKEGGKLTNQISSAMLLGDEHAARVEDHSPADAQFNLQCLSRQRTRHD